MKISSPLGAQTIINRDPELSRMIDEISSERIEIYISGSSETILNDNLRVRIFSEGVPASSPCPAH